MLEIIRKLLAAKLSGKENPILGPILEHLTKGVGLSADASQAVAAFAVGKLASGLITDSGAGGAEASGRPPSEAPLSSLIGLMARMTSDEQVDKEFVISSGLAGELSQQAGLDPDQAAAGLAEVFSLLRGERGDREGD